LEVVTSTRFMTGTILSRTPLRVRVNSIEMSYATVFF
jgi:hypothetical protein